MKTATFFIAAVFAMFLFAGAGGPPGNNGTVKIHDEAENEPIIANEPKVCTFHIHFFFSDPTQDGLWVVRSWAPTGDGTTVLSGSYDTSPSGEYQTAYFTLPDGHYKLEWQGRNEQNIKHKVFWVTCETTEPSPTPTPSPSATPTPSSSIQPSPSASISPTPTPTLPPTSSPSPSPSATPTNPPTFPPTSPTPKPTSTPTPTQSPMPTFTLPPTDTE